MSAKEEWLVTGDSSLFLFFHLSTPDDDSVAICGRATFSLANSRPASKFGAAANSNEQFCGKCAHHAAEFLRNNGVVLEVKESWAPFEIFGGSPIDTSKPMEVDWHEQYRQAALRAKARLEMNDSRELRDQIAEAVSNNTSAQIFGSVFKDASDLYARFRAVYEKNQYPSIVTKVTPLG